MKQTARWILRASLGLALFFAAAVAWLISDSTPILFESLESRTKAGTPVFNRVQWKPGWSEETWVMQQSHSGLNRKFEEWDLLSIEVKNKAARFRQHKQGRIDQARRGTEIPRRAVCFMCHTNGPRALRPNYGSKNISVSLRDKLRIMAWNLRIKTYGRLKEHASHSLLKRSDLNNGIPFRFPSHYENKRLEIRSCVRCHNNKWWGRGFLTKQNQQTITFMLDNQHMPPKPFSLNHTDRKELLNFLHN